MPSPLLSHPPGESQPQVAQAARDQVRAIGSPYVWSQQVLPGPGKPWNKAPPSAPGDLVFVIGAQEIGDDRRQNIAGRIEIYQSTPDLRTFHAHSPAEAPDWRLGKCRSYPPINRHGATCYDPQPRHRGLSGATEEPDQLQDNVVVMAGHLCKHVGC